MTEKRSRDREAANTQAKRQSTSAMSAADTSTRLRTNSAESEVPDTVAGVWIALAATFALVGATWQVVLAVLDGIDSMDEFLAAKNALMREERARIRASVPRWALFRRRRELRKVERLAQDAMTERELRIERRFDRQGWAWAFVVAGALLATATAWSELAAA